MPHLTIDLGELRADDVSGAGHSRPLWERLRRLKHHLRLAATVLSVILLLALAGASGPVLTPLRPVFQVAKFSQYTLDDQNLYVVTGGAPEEPSTLTAYSLLNGEIHWQSPLPGGSRSSQLHMVDDLILIIQRGLGGERISRADPDTGELMWSIEASTFISLPESRLLLSMDPFASPGLSMFDMDTGDVWGTDIGMDFPESFAASANHFVTTSTDDRTLRVYDIRTGELTATGPLSVEQVDSIHVTSSTLVLSYRADGMLTTSGYDVATLAHRWTTSQPPAPDPSFTQLLDCNPYVCLFQGHQLQALDPESGESQWAFEVELPPDGLVALITSVATGSLFAGQILVTQLVDGLPSSWLLDVETGEPVHDLVDWIVPPTNVDWNHPLIGYRMVSETNPVGIGQLTPDQPGFELLGEVGPMPHGFCQSRWPYVACGSSIASGERTLTVWKVRA